MEINFFETVERIFHDWHYDHPRILYALMRSLKPKVAVEVGTYRGYAACYMAQALKENGEDGHLYCIDDFSEGMQKKYDSHHWEENVAKCGLSGYITLIVGKSEEVVWPKQVDFAYIDGWHSLRQCESDFILAANRGAECICLDDVTSTVGPSLFVQELRKNGDWDVLEIFRDCGLAVCVRRKAKPPVTFSQELPNHPGVVLTGMTVEQKWEHLDEASKVTSVDYSEFEMT